MLNWTHRIRRFVPALLVGAALLTSGGALYAASLDNDSTSIIDLSDSTTVDDTWERTFPSMAKLTLQEAIQIALVQAPGQVVEAELEKEDGYWVYEIAVVESTGAMTEVTIDAEHGAVLEIELEADDD
jgi:uncharacterized membrane protein YkoI